MFKKSIKTILTVGIFILSFMALFSFISVITTRTAETTEDSTKVKSLAENSAEDSRKLSYIHKGDY